jgi:hypothetical protein
MGGEMLECWRPPDRRSRAFAVETTASPGVPAMPIPPVMPIPALEMRSSLSAELAGRREIPACRQTYPRSALARLRGGDHRISRGSCHANPSVMPIPALEMRSSLSAEPKGRREIPHAARHPPRSALPRLRGGDHRISRGSCHANPSVMPIPAVEMRSSLSAEPRGRREIPASRQTSPPDRRSRAFEVETTASPRVLAMAIPPVMPIPCLEMHSSLSAEPKGRREVPACRQTYPPDRRSRAFEVETTASPGGSRQGDGRTPARLGQFIPDRPRRTGGKVGAARLSAHLGATTIRVLSCQCRETPETPRTPTSRRYGTVQ